jgi:hypothetical protein
MRTTIETRGGPPRVSGRTVDVALLTSACSCRHVPEEVAERAQLRAVAQFEQLADTAVVARVTGPAKFISRCRKGGIHREFPGTRYSPYLGEIRNGKSANDRKAWKLLNDDRFEK